MNDKIHILNDVSYGKHERQKVDIFIPQNIKNKSGIILFIHGGGWSDGDKSCHRADAEYFSNIGYICATMNYRFVSENFNVFDELDEISSVLKVIKRKCSEFGLNTSKLILSGGSAGGHLSLLYAYTRYNEAPVTPVAVCAYCPPVNCYSADFLNGISSEFDDWKYDILSKCCGYKIKKSDFFDFQQQEALKKISPDNYVCFDSVPTAVFHGMNDNLVPINHIKNFLMLLNQYGIKNDLIIYENSGHTMKDDPEKSLESKKIINEYAEKYF